MATQATLQIAGMHCGSCAQRLGRVLERHDGVIKAEVDYPAGTAMVRYDETRLDGEQLGQLVRAAGFDIGREV